MTKIPKMISVDNQDWNNFILEVGKGNVSKHIGEYILSYVDSDKKTTLDLQIMKKEQDKLRGRIARDRGQLRKITDEINRIEEKIDKNRLKELKTEQEIIKKSKSCLICGNIINNEFNNLKVKYGIICHSCFMSRPAEEINKYTK